MRSSSTASCTRSSAWATARGGRPAREPQLTWGHRKTFDRSTRGRRAAPRSLAAQAREAVTLYHVVVESTLAQPGQHFIEDYLRSAT